MNKLKRNHNLDMIYPVKDSFAIPKDKQKEMQIGSHLMVPTQEKYIYGHKEGEKLFIYADNPAIVGSGWNEVSADDFNFEKK